MKPTDFSSYISNFISKYLPNERGSSRNTISAYRDTFVLLIGFIEKEKKVKIEKITLETITKKTILDFLDWLQVERKSSDSTRNARLAAIHSFYKYVQYESLENLDKCQSILAIKFKKSQKKNMNYLTVEGIKLLLRQPDCSTERGQRDLALLALMYDSGSRVQEIIDLTPSSLRLNKPPTLHIIGKGNKARLVPLLDSQVEIIKKYLKASRLDLSSANQYPLFSNSRKEKLSRVGVNYIIQKYIKMARMEDSSIIPEKISCHSLRHSKAMHLFQAGVNLVYIRDILGHVSIQTTEIYARADSKQKRLALEKAYVNVNPKEEAEWANNNNLINWLKKF